MRKILSNLHEVAHFWANGVQSEGENSGGSFSFNRGTLYSYATPIAHRSDKHNVTLFLDESFSVSTSKHQSYAYSAAHGKTLNVKNLGVSHYGWGDSGDTRTMHKDNLQYFKDNIKESLIKSSRARKYADMHLRDALEAVSNHNDYLSIFKIKRKAIYIDQFNVDALLDKANKQRKAQRIAENKRATKILKDAQENIDKWISGENSIIPWNVSKCFLRLNTEKQIIETSKGANIPVSFTKPLWKMIKRCVKNKAAFTPDYNHSVKLGYYALNSISQKGDIIVGCHNIQFDELDRMAKIMDFA